MGGSESPLRFPENFRFEEQDILEILIVNIVDIKFFHAKCVHQIEIHLPAYPDMSICIITLVSPANYVCNKLNIHRKLVYSGKHPAD